MERLLCVNECACDSLPLLSSPLLSLLLLLLLLLLWLTADSPVSHMLGLCVRVRSPGERVCVCVRVRSPGVCE